MALKNKFISTEFKWIESCAHGRRIHLATLNVYVPYVNISELIFMESVETSVTHEFIYKEIVNTKGGRFGIWLDKDHSSNITVAMPFN